MLSIIASFGLFLGFSAAIRHSGRRVGQRPNHWVEAGRSAQKRSFLLSQRRETLIDHDEHRFRGLFREEPHR